MKKPIAFVKHLIASFNKSIAKTSMNKPIYRLGFTLYLSGSLLLFPLHGKGQGLTSFFCDLSGVQNVTVDSSSANGRTRIASKNAKSQFAIGVKFTEMKVNRDLHFGMSLAYRQINMSNFNLLDKSRQPIYEKIGLFEVLVGVTYLPRKPVYQNPKRALHFTLSGYAGFQGIGLGSNLSGGFLMLSKEGLTGLAVEFVYRPLDYNYPNANPDTNSYVVKLNPSWAIRVALTFGKNIKYSSGS